MTLIPLRGTDFNSASQVQSAWDRGALFQMATSAGHVSKKDCAGKDVYIKFNNLTDLVIVKG